MQSQGKFPYSISVAVPCYNEEANVERVVKGALEYLAAHFNDYEIIIINDGSADRTGETADKIAAGDPHVRVIHHRTNKGYGGSIKAGYYAAVKELTCLFPGDGQFRIDELANLIPLMERVDTAATYRINRRDPFNRKVNQFIYNKAILFLFGLNLKDIDCGFKLMKTEIFRNIELETTGALIDAEFYFKSKKRGFTHEQVGVNHYPRLAGDSTGAKLYVIIHAAYEILKFWWKIRKYH
ncbi:glycosyltransferase family 2 protein [bacterium]|nr:glycosyltransferase family 2 protein [bacterium]